MKTRKLRTASGSALVVVLWVLSLMSLLITSLVFDAHVEARVTSYYRKRTKATYLAQSGIEIAKMLLKKRIEIGDQEEPKNEDDRWFEPARRLRNGPVSGLVEELGEGTVILDIVPEPARRNINNLDLLTNNTLTPQELERNLEQILEVSGIKEETGLWPQLIDPFLDWIDKDDIIRADGAETDDYYGIQKPPYKAKNGALDTVGELLLVKGFSRAILYGGVIQSKNQGPAGEAIPVSGIEHLLTTYGSGKVDVNAASKEVLMTLPGVDEIMAGAIIEEREGLADDTGNRKADFFKAVPDITTRIPDIGKTEFLKYLTVGGGVYRITSVGDVGGVKRRVWCIAEYVGQDLKILQWREEN